MRAEKHQNYAQKCPSWLPPGACCRLSLGSGQQHLGFVLQGLGRGGRRPCPCLFPHQTVTPTSPQDPPPHGAPGTDAEQRCFIGLLPQGKAPPPPWCSSSSFVGLRAHAGAARREMGARVGLRVPAERGWEGQQLEPPWTPQIKLCLALGAPPGRI